MPDFALPEDPLSHPLGLPRPKREEEFHKLQAAVNLPTDRIIFQGKTRDFPIIRVPINLPKYRLANGRTSSSQEEWLAKNGGQADFFETDAELLEVQAIQHKLLLDLASEGALMPYFEDAANTQVNPILLDEAGFVINGNRRLATWRHLLATSAEKYGHFRHIDAVVLPHCDEREIDRIESAEQIKRDIKAGYSWHAQANMMLGKRKRFNASDKEIAEEWEIKEREVRELIDMRNYAAEYLKSRGNDLQWSMVRDRYAFAEIVAGRAKISSPGEQELFKQCAFTLVDNAKEVGGRLYDAIPGIQLYLDEVKAKLQSHFNAQPATINNDMQSLFGGAPQAGEDPINMPLAAMIQKSENSDAARKIIVEVVDSQKQLKKDSNTAGFLVNSLAKAQGLLASAIKEGLRPESTKTGAQKQIDQIREQLNQIEVWLGKNAQH